MSTENKTETHSETCIGCGVELTAEVLHTPAGHYVGTWCNNVESPEIPGMGCGPHSRWSDYYPSHEEANAALSRGTWVPAL